MKNFEKYTRSFFMPPESCIKWTEKPYIDKAPVWCSVDLRDGNQSLIIPMCLNEKIEFFKHLVRIGFKEIEIGFPAASDTEYEFCRTLIEQNLIPDDVAIQVLTQSREHIINKTFEALSGCKNAIVHLYNSTSVAQREQVFKKSRQEIIDIAVTGAELLKEYRKNTPGNFKFEYSPESFTGTEMEFALEVCNAVIDVWKPAANDKIIINLPVTVQCSMPHIYASQIEYMCKNMNSRENVIVSLHPHNDRGCAVADSEMGLLAGADRIEGTLFGNGERTGNVDIITLALNMFSQGIDPKLDLTDIPAIAEVYERVTRMRVYERQPYSGQLVFAAFSGSHQDAIAKGMKWREDNSCQFWTVPYLPIDPKDVGREYESDVIRINSQSGKGGIGYILEQNYGYDLPPKMRESFGYYIKGISDRLHKEISANEVYNYFKNEYINVADKVCIKEAHYAQKGEIEATVTILFNGKEGVYTGMGNGRLDACSNALKKALGIEFKVVAYKEHALEQSSKSQAVAYVGIETEKGMLIWGAGRHTDIINASVNALVSAINRSLR
ncbi:MAG: 2-isopropylmalate synthase [Oscillospiraceae bacterium]|jgi:2-isopropylmalate synthase